MGDTWRTYEAAKKESGTLEPLVIEGERFVFPAEPKADFGIRMSELIVRFEGKIPDVEAIGLIPLLVGEENLSRLRKVTTDSELAAITADLLREYGYAAEEGADPLAPQPAAKDPPPSPKRSSRTSGSSKRTSTGSSAKKTSRKRSASTRGAGSRSA